MGAVHLVALQPVQKCHANDGRFATRQEREVSEPTAEPRRPRESSGDGTNLAGR